MIQIKCPSCTRWFGSDRKTGEMTCTQCGHTFTVGGGR